MSPRDIIGFHDNPGSGVRTLAHPPIPALTPTLQPASESEVVSRFRESLRGRQQQRQRWAACAGDGPGAPLRRQSPPLPESCCFPSVALTPSQPAGDPPACSPSRRVKQLYDSLPLVSLGHEKSHPGTTAYDGVERRLLAEPNDTKLAADTTKII